MRSCDRRTAICTIAGVISSIHLFAKAAPIPKEMPRYYFPTVVGTRLTYNEDSREVTYCVAKVDKRENSLIVQVNRVLEKQTEAKPFATWEVSSRGLAMIEFEDRKLDPAVWSLKLPPGRNQKWEDEFGNERTATEHENVKLGSTKYDAVRVEGLAQIANADAAMRKMTAWYALDIGLIKSTINGKVVSILQSIQKGR